jgi:hypothetical protein
MELKDYEISFVYFYRVLEFFFLLVRKDEFRNIIADYNRNNNIDVLMSSLTNIYLQNEDAQLLHLLNIINAEIMDVITEAHALRLINVVSVEEFANSLYLYRNSIVHGKSDAKYFIKLPEVIEEKIENDAKLFWNKCIAQIAEILIIKYCNLG